MLFNGKVQKNSAIQWSGFLMAAVIRSRSQSKCASELQLPGYLIQLFFFFFFVRR